MECIRENATILHSSSAIRQQFSGHLPVVLRRGLFNTLEHWVRRSDSWWIQEEFERVFSLVRLLLNESITKFNFGLYGTSFERDHQETWQLLAEKCPNLRHVEDSRKRSNGIWRSRQHVFVEMDIMPDLLKFRKLEHIKMQYHICTGEDVIRLVNAFPNLRTLCVSFTFQHIDHSLLAELFKLQKLEFLRIGLSGLSGRRDRKLAKYLTDDLLAECVRRLPLLREADVYDQHDELHAHHNARQEVLQQPLALRTLTLKETFKGWSCDMLPHVTTLNLWGPLLGVHQFLGFPNLTTLNVGAVSADDCVALLQHFQGQLEELDLDAEGLDPYQIFFLCPNLRKIRLGGDLYEDSCRPDLFPLRAENFKNLRDVHIFYQEGVQPADLLMQIFLAPRLEDLYVYELNLELDQMTKLMDRLGRRQVLQKFRKLEMTTQGIDTATKHLLEPFLKLLPCCSPRLEEIRCRDADDPLFQVLSDESINSLNKLNLPGCSICVSDD